MVGAPVQGGIGRVIPADFEIEETAVIYPDLKTEYNGVVFMYGEITVEPGVCRIASRPVYDQACGLSAGQGIFPVQVKTDRRSVSPGLNTPVQAVGLEIPVPYVI